jgi:DnaJ-class molecular chaperone
MAIQDYIVGVTIISCPDECEACTNTGLGPENNWDTCPRCHGAAKGIAVTESPII